MAIWGTLMCETNRNQQSHIPCKSKTLQPSRFVCKYACLIASNASNLPILDAPCGSGRNVVPFLELGSQVICADRDISLLHTTIAGRGSPLVVPQEIDLVEGRWPYRDGTIGGIINVHFYHPAMLPRFSSALKPAGYLLLETISGRGGNHLELPKSGEVRQTLGNLFEFGVYEETAVGPPEYGAVTLKLLGRKL